MAFKSYIFCHGDDNGCCALNHTLWNNKYIRVTVADVDVNTELYYTQAEYVEPVTYCILVVMKVVFCFRITDC